jgi:DNA polymerase theta
VYSAPTSGGKTLCADVLLVKRVSETRRKALFIVPIVTLAEEKTRSLRELLPPNLAVEGFYRSRGDGFLDSDPNGGADVAVCTIEKSYHLINRIIEKGCMDQLCMVVIDEAHVIGDPDRGALIETILAKV